MVLRVLRGWACFFMSNEFGIMSKFGLGGKDKDKDKDGRVNKWLCNSAPFGLGWPHEKII